MRLTLFCGLETVSALQSKSVKRPASQITKYELINVDLVHNSLLCLTWNELKWRIQNQICLQKNCEIKLAEKSVWISESNVKHFGGQSLKSAVN